MTLLRVVIADDHLLVRSTLRALLKRTPDIEVVAEAANGQEAVELVSHLQPDLILMDVSMPIMDGITATRHILERKLPTQVLVLSMYADTSLARQALQLGARGYLLKAHASSDLLTAICQVMQGKIVISPELKPLLGAL